jgi:S1-C subfamily serine protease
LIIHRVLCRRSFSWSGLLQVPGGQGGGIVTVFVLKMRSKVIIVCGWMVALLALAGAQSPPPRRLSLSQTPPGVVYVSQRIDIIRQLGPAENIATLDGEPLPMMQSRNITLGLVINDEGYVISRLSGVSPEDPPQDVLVYTSTSPQLPASFIGMDTVTGLCVLKVEKQILKVPAFATSPVLPARGPVTLFGFNPQQLSRPVPGITMVRPRINNFPCSLTRATSDFRYNPKTPIYYLTRPDLTPVQDGSVVMSGPETIFGIAVYDLGGEGNHLVYPITRILGLAQTIISTKDSIAHGWLGATGVELSAPIRAAKVPGIPRTPTYEPGVRINGVIPDSPAEMAGVQLQDILLKVSGRRVTNLAQLGDTLRQLPADSEVMLQVKRGSEYKSLQAKLTTSPAPTPAKQIDVFKARLSRMEESYKSLSPDDPNRRQLESKIGAMKGIIENIFNAAPLNVRLKILYGFETEAEPLTAQLKTYFATTGSLLVTTVNAGGRAARAGLMAGDVIVRVGDKELKELNALVRTLDENASANMPIELTVTRQRELVKIVLSW